MPCLGRLDYRTRHFTLSRVLCRKLWNDKRKELAVWMQDALSGGALTCARSRLAIVLTVNLGVTYLSTEHRISTKT